MRTDKIDSLFLICCCCFADMFDYLESRMLIARKNQFIVVAVIVDVLFAEVELDVKDLTHFNRRRLNLFLWIFVENLLVCVILKVTVCI